MNTMNKYHEAIGISLLIYAFIATTILGLIILVAMYDSVFVRGEYLYDDSPKTVILLSFLGILFTVVGFYGLGSAVSDISELEDNNDLED